MLLNKVENLRNKSPKFNELCQYIEGLNYVALAFSGGVDSTFLLAICQTLLGSQKFIALTVKAPYIPNWEIKEALSYTETLGVKHRIIEMEIPEEIKHNPDKRCYTCKQGLFDKMIEAVKDEAYTLIDGSNYDDLSDYRPGMIALKELDIKSPLLFCKVSKDEIRKWSQQLDLPTWNKPAYACLLTRLPHDRLIEEDDLKQIEQAEIILFQLGITAVRVRKHDDIARIETAEHHFETLLKNRYVISEKLREIGFKHITLDLEGYQLSGKKTQKD